MKQRPSHSYLQNRILLYLKSQQVNSIADLARSFNAHRSAVSRAMHALQKNNLVDHIDGSWNLTKNGEEEIEKIKSQLTEHATKANQTASRLLEQGLFISKVSSEDVKPVSLKKDDIVPTKKNSSAVMPEKISEKSNYLSLINQSFYDLALSNIKVHDMIASSLAPTQEIMKAISKLVTYDDYLQNFREQVLGQQAIQKLMDTRIIDQKWLDQISASRLASEQLSRVSAEICEANRRSLEQLNEVAKFYEEANRHAIEGIYSNSETFANRTDYLLNDKILEILKQQSATEILFNTLSTGAFPHYAELEKTVQQLGREVLSSFSFSQQIGLISLQAMPSIGIADSWKNELSKTNLELSKIIKDVSEINTNRFSTDKMADFYQKCTTLPTMAEVGRTYTVLIGNVLKDIHQGSFSDDQLNIYLPARTSHEYVHSIRGVFLGNANDETDLISTIDYSDNGEDRMFTKLGDRFLRMWRGAWEVLESGNPDKVRQSAHSCRELLMQTLAEIAPNTLFTNEEIQMHGKDGSPTRKMRVKKILEGRSESSVEWVESMAKTVDATYYRATAVSHNRESVPPVSEGELKGLLRVTSGIIQYLLSYDE